MTGLTEEEAKFANLPLDPYISISKILQRLPSLQGPGLQNYGSFSETAWLQMLDQVGGPGGSQLLDPIKPLTLYSQSSLGLQRADSLWDPEGPATPQGLPGPPLSGNFGT